MPNCKNNPRDPNDRWNSILGSTPDDGYFVIDTENAGVCSGNHFDSSGGSKQAVEGKCTGRRIHLFLPTGNPQFVYAGLVKGKKFVGFRFSGLNAVSKDGVVALAEPDDWTGEKPPTLFKKSAKKGTSKKAAGKKATSKKTKGKKAAG